MTYPFLQLPEWYFELTTALSEASKMSENSKARENPYIL